ESIISLTTSKDKIVFPPYDAIPRDTFIQKINSSGKKWVIFTDENNEPKLALDTDGFIRSELFCNKCAGIEKFCHTPFVIRDEKANLGEIILGMKHESELHSDTPIDKDIVLLWTDNTKRIITGSDIYGRLLKGI
ncbi:Mg2+ and Co2+ transporter CorB, partial [Bacteroidota bacterium]